MRQYQRKEQAEVDEKTRVHLTLLEYGDVLPQQTTQNSEHTDEASEDDLENSVNY